MKSAGEEKRKSTAIMREELPTLEELQEMSKVDVRTVSPEDVTDIDDVEIDMEQPAKERMKSYIRQMKNPYIMKANGVIVKMSYAEGSGKTLTDCLNSLLELGAYPPV